MSVKSPTMSKVCCLVDEVDHNMLQDIQLAAELGKTLLERNKQLENTIRSQQNKLDDQVHEIEYMKKQTAALREVNDSRLKIYEQLELSIQDLERANHLLVVENTNNKKLLKTQSVTVENLEFRCEDVQKKLNEMKSSYQDAVRQKVVNDEPQDKIMCQNTHLQDSKINEDLSRTLDDAKEIDSLLKQLQEVRNQKEKEHKIVVNLENQITSLLHENNTLEEHLNLWRNKAMDVKNLQDELNTLEEVRQGHLCGRCLRGINIHSHEALTLMMNKNEYEIPEDDDICITTCFMNRINQDSTFSVQEPNSKTATVGEILDSYKLSFTEDKGYSSNSKGNAQMTCLSLQEELRMTEEFNSFQNTVLESNNHVENKLTRLTSYKKSLKAEKKLSGMLADYSESGTLSFDFSDEIRNKSTQTDGRPGSLLCSIADGDNCQLSIYDDNSTFESRFNQTPEYKQIFIEIFSVLKRTAEAKDETKKLSQNSISENSNVVPIFPFVTNDISESTDDNQSVMSTISSVVSEPVFRIHAPIIDKREKHKSGEEKNTESAYGLFHKKCQQLDHLSNQTRKKPAKKNIAKNITLEAFSTPEFTPTINYKFVHNKTNNCSRRKFRPLTNSDIEGGVWNGHTTHFYSNRSRGRRLNNSCSRSSSDQNNSRIVLNDYKPSAASQEIAKLKKLDMSYAEVLRMPNKPKGSNVRKS